MSLRLHWVRISSENESSAGLSSCGFHVDFRAGRFAGEPPDEPKSQTGTLSNAADCLRLLRSLRLRPQFGISSAVGAVLLVAMLRARCRWSCRATKDPARAEELRTRPIRNRHPGEHGMSWTNPGTGSAGKYSEAYVFADMRIYRIASSRDRLSRNCFARARSGSQ